MCVCACAGCVCMCVDVFPISPGHPYPTLSQNPPLTHLKQITRQLFELKPMKTKENYLIRIKNGRDVRLQLVTPVEVPAELEGLGVLTVRLCTLHLFGIKEKQRSNLWFFKKDKKVKILLRI